MFHLGTPAPNWQKIRLTQEIQLLLWTPSHQPAKPAGRKKEQYKHISFGQQSSIADQKYRKVPFKVVSHHDCRHVRKCDKSYDVNHLA